MSRRSGLPPIVGMPASRPICPMCGNKLKPIVKDVVLQDPIRVASRTFVRWDMPYGVFDTLRCAKEFANAAFRAGYRIKPKLADVAGGSKS